MKNKKQIIKKICVTLCVLMVSVSFLGATVPFYANSSVYLPSLGDSELKSLLYGREGDRYKNYTRYIVYFNIPTNSIRMMLYQYTSSSCYGYVGKHVTGNYSGDVLGQANATTYVLESDGSSWSKLYDGRKKYYYEPLENVKILASSHDIYLCDKVRNDGSVYDGNHIFSDTVFMGALPCTFGAYNNFDIPTYSPSLGYLQNVKHNVVFDDVPLGENVGETFTERWYYDSFSTTGVDLTSGDYVIRYYQEKWIVTGYGEDDVVKKSDRYVLGDYIVQNGYIETYSENVESTLAGQGYVEPSIFDLLWNKFVTTHYYFQIVNAKTNEVGGLLHVYLTDDNGKFGVEHIGETLDNDGNYDEGGYKDFIDEDKVTTDDVEQGFNDLENGSNVDFGTVDGVDEFGVILESFASQVSNVTGGVHALLSSMPPWVLGLLGVSFVLLVVGIIFKIV